MAKKDLLEDEQEDAAENKLYKNLDPSSEAYKQWMDKRRRQQDQDEYADLAKLENSSDKNQKHK